MEVHTQRAGVDATRLFIGGPGFWLGRHRGDDRSPAPSRHGRQNRLPELHARLPRAEIVRLTESEPQAWRYFALLLMRNYGTVMKRSSTR